MEAGVGGRGCISERGVFGGSMLGATLFHDSTNVESSAASAGTSAVESARRGRPAKAAREVRRRAAWRSIFVAFLFFFFFFSLRLLFSGCGCGRGFAALESSGGVEWLESEGPTEETLELGWAVEWDNEKKCRLIYRRGFYIIYL
jgi:hypothetical protein